MGQFSWLYSDNGKQMIDDKCANSYMLVPSHMQEKYGKYIKEDCYDGYGRMGGYDVYDLVVEWNREYLNEDMLRKPLRERYIDEEHYLKAKKSFESTLNLMEKYNAGATDEEMVAYAKEIGYGWSGDGSEWKRTLGIDIACYNEQNASLPYPIKITSKPMDYEYASASQSDPNQGWETY